MFAIFLLDRTPSISCSQSSDGHRVGSAWSKDSTTDRVLALIAAVATGLGILMAFVPSCYFANPLPFTLVLTSPPWLAVLGGGLVFYLRHEIRSNPAAKKDLRQYWTIILTQLHLPLVYPLYHFLFSSLSGTCTKAAFVPVLSVIKLAFKNVMNRALYGLDDLKPQTIILNVEAFHALFATYSMQNSSSSLTAMALVALDFFHACVSFYDVNELLAQVTTLVDSLRTTKATTDMSVLEIALFVINEETEDVEPEDTANVITSLMPTVKHLTQVAPLPQIETPARASARQQRASTDYTRAPSVQGPPVHQERRLLLHKTLQLLYLTEFILLIEFVEIIIPPSTVLIYLNAMFHLPNRAYYPAIKDMDNE
ncbi:hypothetical protein Poli38472_010692 [Pythium oligandrum]|uniref:Uncharacterized protein n=1 Tax=Pythium oligandrum TaxID=41045 RepID=A0A8K1CDW4_PYTOL|nr:hypothetical protein Poli38472_010692 [Pythium oligandrum]|eukprot:TMW61629.1 hypothetical protein Poli38472_010692 [Pythium oligandrum]